MTSLFITVPGQPQGKGRARFGNGRTYTPAKTVAYEGLIALAGQQAMQGQEPLTGPLSIAVTAYFAIPKSWPKKRKTKAASSIEWHTSAPDGDNVLKACGDGLNGVVWADDRQIANARVMKLYDATPRLEIIVEVLR